MIFPIVAAGAVGEGALAWWNPNLFLKNFSMLRETDDQVDLLNNYWVLLARSAKGLDPQLQARLDSDEANWWTWRTQYYDAVFRRALDPTDLWGGGAQSKYERELGGWKDRYLEMMEAVIAAVPGAAEELIGQGVDPDLQFQSFPDAKGNSGFLWGLGAVVLLVGFGAYAAFSSEGYRKSQHSAYRRSRPRRRTGSGAGSDRKSPSVSFKPRRREEAWAG
jgi:hypothetical protein